MVMGEMETRTEFLVIGGGPAGLVAALRAATLGLEVTLISREQYPGGYWLHRGPAALHLIGQCFHHRGELNRLLPGSAKVDSAELLLLARQQLSRSSEELAEKLQRAGVQLLSGQVSFQSPDSVRIMRGDVSRVRFRSCLVATGSRPLGLPSAPTPWSNKILGGPDIIKLKEIPENAIVVGGGPSGVQTASLLCQLGSQVTLVEEGSRLLPVADQELVAQLVHQLRNKMEIRTDCQVNSIHETMEGVTLDFTGDHPSLSAKLALLCTGRRADTQDLSLERAAVEVDTEGAIVVNESLRSSNPQIFAAGDVTAGPMTSHRARQQGRLVAEIVSGKQHIYDPRAIPIIVGSYPELAWCGLTGQEARQMGIPVKSRLLDWQQGPGPHLPGTPQGMSSFITDVATGRLLGAGFVGTGAGKLIAEALLAVELGALLEDLSLCMHPWPGLSSLVEDLEDP